MSDISIITKAVKNVKNSNISNDELTDYVRESLLPILPTIMKKYKDTLESAPNDQIPKLFDQLCEYLGVIKASSKVNFLNGAAVGSTIATEAMTNAFQAMASGMGVPLKPETIKGQFEKMDEMEKTDINDINNKNNKNDKNDKINEKEIIDEEDINAPQF